MQCFFEPYGIKRICSVYFNRTGQKAWVKSWFNGNDEGQAAVPIRRAIAAAFIRGDITKDQMLSRYFPQTMKICQKVEGDLRNEMLGVG